MSASHACSPIDAAQVDEEVGARVSRLEMYMQQNSETMQQGIWALIRRVEVGRGRVRATYKGVR